MRHAKNEQWQSAPEGLNEVAAITADDLGIAPENLGSVANAAPRNFGHLGTNPFGQVFDIYCVI